ncbi:MAG: hypothetical protein ACE5K8_09395 [Candidatus Zixiibacteriota bacterium]
MDTVISVIATIVGSIVTAVIIKVIEGKKRKRAIKVVNSLEEISLYDHHTRKVIDEAKKETTEYACFVLPPVLGEVLEDPPLMAIVVGALLGILTYWLLSGNFPFF